eukprot:TRINITY_DN1568_c0_g1_i1.p1 TRINITY_DN1568_c0_g1~~TRINITY_DN1568_c0_g1_i1.p1  ORF type:complete len:582 (-),score=244.19 TRINITY_DN1568_c0_g1_i1:63-1718(-)
MAQTLQPRSMTVNDIRLDIQDGVRLINFFELLSGKRAKGYDATPKNRINKINNLSIALNFLERDMFVSNPGCCAEDIIDAETKGIKMILGLLWILFRKYRMNPVDVAGAGGKMKEEDAMIEWVRTTVDGYAGIEVKNFKTSFNDGKVLLALVHAFDKEDPAFDYNEVIKHSTEEVLETAFDFAEKKLGVNKLLDVQEVLDGNVDERSMALYTTLFHHAFKTKKEMLDMQSKLGNQSQALAMEMKSKDELVKLNYDLTANVEQLKKTLGEENEHSERLNDMCDELKKDRDSTMEEAESLRKEVALLKEQLAVQLAAKEGDAKALTEKLMEETKSRIEMEEKLRQLEKTHEETTSSLEEARAQVENTKKDLESSTADLTAHKKQAKVNTSGLKVLRTNLEQHLDDINRWQKYIDGAAGEVSVVEQMSKTEDELEKLAAPDQLALLSKKLEDENVLMTKLLKEKREEQEKLGKKSKSFKKGKEEKESSSATSTSASSGMSSSSSTNALTPKSERKADAEKKEEKKEEKKTEEEGATTELKKKKKHSEKKTDATA